MLFNVWKETFEIKRIGKDEIIHNKYLSRPRRRCFQNSILVKIEKRVKIVVHFFVSLPYRKIELIPVKVICPLIMRHLSKAE